MTLSACLLLASTLLAAPAHGENSLRLRAVNPRSPYHPGDVIVVEVACAPEMTDDVFILSEPGSVTPTLFPNCPRAVFEIRVPADFVGRGKVSALVRRGDTGTFSFNVTSDIPPADLHITSSGAMVDPDECSTLSFDPDGPGAQTVQFVAEQPDGTLFDLCKGAEVRVTTDQPDSFRFATDGHSCSITSRREGSFKLVATYGGLRKEFSCRAQNFGLEPEPTAPTAPVVTPPVAVAPGPRITAAAVSQVPAAKAVRASTPEPRSAGRPGVPIKISIPAFRNDPLKLDHRPMDVGRCRLLEHWTTGYCYVYGLGGSAKVSENTDVRCDDLVELRKRMLRAIEAGHCN